MLANRNTKKIKMVKKSRRSQRTSVKFPDAVIERRALPSTVLTALIGEDAANKLAVNEPLAFHVHCGASEYLVLYVGNHVPQSYTQ